MLKLSLEPDKSLERTLPAAARQLERLVEEGISEGIVRIRVYPRPETILSSIPLLAVLGSFGIRPIYKVSVRPPPRIDTPTVIIGYNNPSYKSSEISSALLSVSHVAETPPPPGATYVAGQGSLPAILGLIFTAAGGTYSRREHLLLLLAGAYWGSYIEKTGKMHGLDRIFYEALIEAGLNLEVVNTIKVYRPGMHTICEGVASTLDPYYPGLTGVSDHCIELLQGNGAGEYTSRIAATLKRDELEKIALIILSYIREYTGRDVDVGEYISGLVTSKTLNYDPRLRANSILYAIDSTGDYSLPLSLATRLEDLTESLENHHLSISKPFADFIENARLIKTRIQPWIRGYKIDLADGVSPLFAWRALRYKGRVNESMILFEDEDMLCASTLQVEEALGYGESRKLIEVKAAEERGLRLCVKENATR